MLVSLVTRKLNLYWWIISRFPLLQDHHVISVKTEYHLCRSDWVNKGASPFGSFKKGFTSGNAGDSGYGYRTDNKKLRKKETITTFWLRYH